MITPIDTRGRWIAEIVERSVAWLEGTAPTEYRDEFLREVRKGNVALWLSAGLGITERKLSRWLDASPDLRAAFVAKGWRP